MEQNILPVLGRCLSYKEVASYLGVEVRVVRKYCEQLGGFRLGKKYVFLEKGLRDALQAKIRGLDGPDQGAGRQAAAALQDAEGGFVLGSIGAENGAAAEVESLSLPF